MEETGRVSKIPSNYCKSTKGDLMATHGVTVYNMCEICRDDGILCRIGSHPQSYYESVKELLTVDV